MWSLLELFPEDFLINILDIGAALNENPPYQSLIDAGRARIIGFEPNTQECEKLNHEYGAPHRFFPYFVSDGQPATFHETNWVLTGSLFEPNMPLLDKFWNLGEVMTKVASHSVSTTRIDDISEIGDVDFIKIDVQGAELAVFRNALRILADTVLIQTEVEFVEFYKGQPMFADVDIFLRGQGFQFHSFDGFGRRAFKPLIGGGNLNDGFRQCLWSDALYVRDWMNLESLPEPKLRNYAVLAHDVLQSYDLAHLVLAALDRKTGRNISKEYVRRMTEADLVPTKALHQHAGTARVTSATDQKEPSSAELNQLVALFNARQLQELERRATLLAEQHPDSGFVWKALGAAIQMQGRNGLSPLRRASELLPNDAEAQNNLGNVLQHLGQLDEAIASYHRALEINPNYAEACNNLGNVQQDIGLLEDALASYQRALQINPELGEAYNSMGTVLQEIGQLDHALKCFRRSLEINPANAVAFNNLGNIQHALGAYDDAVSSYNSALEFDPNYAEAFNNLGSLLKDVGYLEEALTCYQRALEKKPAFALALSNLGATQQALGQTDSAIASYRRALELTPDLALAHANLGAALQELGKIDDALKCYRCALEINPNSAMTLSNMGMALIVQGHISDAETCFRQAHQLQPQNLQYAIQSKLLLPIIPDTQETVIASRERYLNGISALRNITGVTEDPGNDLNTSAFYLAYHNHNDRRIMEAMCSFFRARISALTYTAPHLFKWQTPAAAGRRIRVGFISELLVRHTIGKLYQGFIRNLDRTRFEVVVIHTPKSKKDSLSKTVDQLADKAISLSGNLVEQQQIIAAEQLDVLFYPDIGMTPSTYFMAYARLAPIQATSYGHPDTSGLDTIDYFVSTSLIEPEGAEDHYTERLICLNRLPCFYEPLIVPKRLPTRTALGLPKTGTLYGCPQTLIKFHPDFDAILAGIAEGDPDGHIVLIEDKQDAVVNSLKSRWARTFPDLLKHVIFLPRMPLEQFMDLMAVTDVLLDPIHFGSGNTMYEGMVSGTPIVTWPGKFMRGRIVAGAYRQMGVSDAPVAASLEEYAATALGLGCNPERRANLRRKLRKAAAQNLFEDTQAVREFEFFLEAAVASAERGEKLCSHWRPMAE